MKKIILSGLFALFVVSVFAQKTTTEERPAETITKTLVEKYQLTTAQEAKMLKIQTRKLKNIDQFASLETTDVEKYLQKMAANARQTRFSIRMMLNKEQAKILDQEEMDLRKKRADISQKMQKEGASKLDIQKAILPFE